MFERFADTAIKAVMLAQEEAQRFGHNFVGSEQILLGIVGEETSDAAQRLADAGVTLDRCRTEVEQLVGQGSGLPTTEVRFTPKAKRILEAAAQLANQTHRGLVYPEHLLAGLLADSESAAIEVLERLEVDIDQLQQQLQLDLLDSVEEIPVSAGGAFANPSRGKAGKTPALDEFGTDLTQLAAAGKIDPVVGRDREIERTVQILGRRTKNNPILLGEPGVGKTAIAEGLAQRIANQDVPSSLLDKRVMSLDLSLMVAGTQLRGEFEERLTRLVDEVRQSGNVILVIDEVHTLLGTGGMQGSMDAANLLKPALARGELQCIGATTLDEYRQHIERDEALARRFQPVQVNAPSATETVEILKGLRGRYEQHHRVQMTDAALEAAALLSDRYIADRHLPDKAIDLIDEAGSRVRLRSTGYTNNDRALRKELRQVMAAKQEAVEAQDFQQAGKLRDRERALLAQLQPETADSAATTPIVDADDIAQIVSSWTGIPVTKLTESESALLVHLEEQLHQRVIGQDEAVTAVSRAMRRARAGMRHSKRPIASFLFSGPTGVGKTELAKALAVHLCGSETALVRVDMSEYMERHTISKLIGAPPGFLGYGEGGQLTEAVRRQPYSVVLFDEVEKAHPDVFNLLLQILEDGRLTDAQGRVVNFSNTLIILTSNLGSRAIEKGGGGLGFEFQSEAGELVQHHRIQTAVKDEFKQFFRPEFLNRLDDIVVFRQLEKAEVTQIAELMVQEIASRLQDREIDLQVTDAFKAHAVAMGYSPSYGARALRRVLTRLLEDNLAEAILSGRLVAGDTAVVDLDDDGQVQVQSARSRQLALEPAPCNAC